MSPMHLPTGERAVILSTVLLTLGLGVVPAMAAPGDAPPPQAQEESDDDSADPQPPEAIPVASPAASAEVPSEVCHDDEDNDGDGLVDCDDLEDCKSFATCGWILGGWLWIWTIFSVTLGALVLYAWFITVRLRRARSEGASIDV